ncbi:hypothetical protein LINPERHAP1_LOCUS27329 [Linum perenne]
MCPTICRRPKMKDCILCMAAKLMESSLALHCKYNEPLLASFCCSISTAAKSGFRAFPFIIGS